jgi:hypothetical protein
MLDREVCDGDWRLDVDSERRLFERRYLSGAGLVGEDMACEETFVAEAEKRVELAGRSPVNAASSLVPDLLLDKSEPEDDVVETERGAGYLERLTG